MFSKSKRDKKSTLPTSYYYKTVDENAIKEKEDKLSDQEDPDQLECQATSERSQSVERVRKKRGTSTCELNMPLMADIDSQDY